MANGCGGVGGGVVVAVLAGVEDEWEGGEGGVGDGGGDGGLPVGLVHKTVRSTAANRRALMAGGRVGRMSPR
jgi:hypothetical protein